MNFWNSHIGRINFPSLPPALLSYRAGLYGAFGWDGSTLLSSHPPGLGCHAKQTRDLLIGISDLMEVSKPPFDPYQPQSFQEFCAFFF